MRVEARRVAADDVAHRVAPGAEAAVGERRATSATCSKRLRWATRTAISRISTAAPARLPRHRQLDHQAGRRGGADQHDHGDDAADAARGLAADFAVEPAVEKSDGAPGQHDRMRYAGKDRRHVADPGVEGEAGGEQQQWVGDDRDHDCGTLGRGWRRVNR